VRAEDPAEPLSDDAIAAVLAKRGHLIARRTVAKYRVELGIPSSYRRRRFT
jgi:RNA polymerase sigma-54 factor